MAVPLASSTILEASLWSSVDIMTDLALRMKILALVFRSGRLQRLRRDLLGGVVWERPLRGISSPPRLVDGGAAAPDLCAETAVSETNASTTP